MSREDVDHCLIINNKYKINFENIMKPPYLRIPTKLIKKEATKEAKRLQKKEQDKIKQQEKKEKLKQKTKLKKEKTTQNKEYWSDFFDEHLRRELLAGIWIMCSVICFALFLSNSLIAQEITNNFFRHFFGQGIWIFPFILLGVGLAIIFHKNLYFPPLRVFAILFFFTAILGFLNLWTPEEDQLELAPQYGGGLGFALSYWLRYFFAGDIILPGAILISLIWLSAVIGFRLKLSTIKTIWQNLKTDQITIDPHDEDKEEVKSTQLVSKDKNTQSLKIIDSTIAKDSIINKKTANPDIVDQTITKDSSTLAELSTQKNKNFANWIAPSFDLLKDSNSTVSVNEKKLRQKAESIREKLQQFNIDVQMKSVHVGPTVTQFTLEPASGVKLNKITALKSDLALALASEKVRIEAPIPGKSLVGIEIPNENRSIVGLKEILLSDIWNKEKSSLKLCLGRDVAGRPIIEDLAKMPHLLIAGKTGSGKSIAMNAFLLSLLWQNSPDTLRMILIDPKRVELQPYDKLPHLLTSVIVEPEKSVSALAWAVAEMNRRYKDFAQKGCRNISEHNDKYTDAKEPFIVIVIDELADLMMVAGKDVEAAICRIAQMARAVGMHLIVATQRPSVDVVTGLIKANLPARIAFRVSSGIDSRTIIDSIGAEDLLGFGDMLNLNGNSGNLTRVQGVLVSNEEIQRVTNHIKLQCPEAMLNDEITAQSIEGMAKGGVLTAGIKEDDFDDNSLDNLYQDAVSVVLEYGKASASLLQRRMEIGYARAARILDQMEKKGVIGPARGSKPREVFGQADKPENLGGANIYK